MRYKIVTNFKTKYIGDKNFYRLVLSVAVPIMVQNGITNFVGLLDNIMVGQCGTEQMSGVAIVNQLFFVYYLCMFGGLAGAGIFTAQYFGNGDHEGVRHTFRYKLWLAVILNIVCFLLLFFFGRELIGLYLSGSADGGDPAATLEYAYGYMNILLLQLPLVMIHQVYSSTLREGGETLLPMKSGIAAVFVNLLFNYLLIYGNFGFPEMGVNGAAVATVISRVLETAIVVVWTHRNKKRNRFIVGIYKTLRVPMHLVKRFFITGAPLLVNETLWSLGVAALTQAYSVRGLNVIAGINIANTINNVFNIVFIAMGDAVAIIVGQLLGAGDLKGAKDKDNKIIAFSVFSAFAVAIIMFVTAPFFPQLYNTNDEAKLLATGFIMLQAFFMTQNGFLHTAYFTLRSGGRTIITFIFDSVFMWCVSVPLAYALVNLTVFHIWVVYALVQAADLVKCAIGYVLVKKNVWMRNLTVDRQKEV